jgi:hypothetical protein
MAEGDKARSGPSYVRQQHRADGTGQPGRVSDPEVSLGDVAKGHATMDEHTALKVMVTP